MMLKNIKRTNGMLVKNEVIYEPDIKKGSTAVKEEAKSKLVVTVNGVPFNADQTSINYMSSVIALANNKYLEALASGMTAEEARAITFDATVKWKGATNNIHTVKISTIAAALEIALGEIANIVGV